MYYKVDDKFLFKNRNEYEFPIENENKIIEQIMENQKTDKNSLLFLEVEIIQNEESWYNVTNIKFWTKIKHTFNKFKQRYNANSYRYTKNGK